MSQNNKLWAIVPAAGSGRRFGSAIPKQYADLAGLPVIQHSLQTLLDSSLFAGIAVMLASDDTLFSTLPLAEHTNLLQVTGGDSRAHSVFNGLSALESYADEHDWVLIHDAARPLLQRQTLEHFVAAMRDEAVGGILAATVHDTLKQIHGSVERSTANMLSIHSTIDRSAVLAAQTPQMFRFGLLYSALRSALQFEKSAAGITDEAAAMELAGQPVKVLLSDLPNLKITTQSDLELAAFYLRREPINNTG